MKRAHWTEIKVLASGIPSGRKTPFLPFPLLEASRGSFLRLQFQQCEIFWFSLTLTLLTLTYEYPFERIGPMRVTQGISSFQYRKLAACVKSLFRIR